MASDSLRCKPSAVPDRPQAYDKVRLRFRKVGILRLISHRDLMKCVERALRRSQLPIHVSQGFHPMPRMVFAMPLGLGIEGLQEVLELELTVQIEPEDVLRRLTVQMPPGLEILSARRISLRQAAQVRRAGYRINVSAERLADLAARIAELLNAQECWVQRERPQRRQLDVRPFISEVKLTDNQLEMMLWVTPNGAARPNEVLTVLGLGDLLEAGAIIERHILELHDETEHSDPLPEFSALGAPDHSLHNSDATCGASTTKDQRPTALVSGPFSFDS